MKIHTHTHRETIKAKRLINKASYQFEKFQSCLIGNM